MRALVVMMLLAAVAAPAAAQWLQEPRFIRVYKPPLIPATETAELQGMGFGAAALGPEHIQALDALISRLKPMVIGSVIITGHSDRIEAAHDPDGVAFQRAHAVRDYLVEKWLDPKLIFWESRSARQPVPVTRFCRDDMEAKDLVACLGPSRRVTVEVLGFVPEPPVKGRRGPPIRGRAPPRNL